MLLVSLLFVAVINPYYFLNLIYIYIYIHIYIYIYIHIYIYIYISLGTLVPNSRERQGKLWLPKKQKTASENNLTITFLSNTSHKSLSTELIAP